MKKVLSLLLLCSMVLTLFSVSAVADGMGDLNGDYSLDAKDSLMVLKYAVGKIELTPKEVAQADTNKDGAVDSKDALVVLKVSVGKLEEPTEEKCYLIVEKAGLTWEQAKAECEAMGGHLATITSPEEQAWIEGLNQKDLSLWTGGYRDDNGTWYWVTGEEFTYTNWGEGEPNNSSAVVSDERYVTLWPDYWNDLANDNIYEQDGYICEFDFALPPVEPEQPTNSRYQIVQESGLTWEEAKARCEEMGGHLATVTSPEEQALLERMNEGSLSLWIGGYRDDDFNWYWVTGEAFAYTNWAEGEPNDSSNVVSNERYIALWPMEWNDLANDNVYEQAGFICEWDDLTEIPVEDPSVNYPHEGENEPTVEKPDDVTVVPETETK